MRKNRVIEQNRCYHLVSRLAHSAFFLDDEDKDRAVALMRRIEAGVQAIMSYCINRAVSISSDPFAPLTWLGGKLTDKECKSLIFTEYKGLWKDHSKVEFWHRRVE